jgi:hypothetical protein
MFILDSLMISGIKWVMNTVITSAEAEMNDDTALREQLLEAEMRREMGEISDDEFGDIEADLLGRIREIKHRREGGSGPLAMGGAEAVEKTADNKFQVEASVSGDFYDPADAPHTTIVDDEPRYGEHIEVLDMQPGATEPQADSGLPLSAPSHSRTKKGTRTRTTRSTRTVTPRTARTTRTSRTAPKSRTSRTSKLSK